MRQFGRWASLAALGIAVIGAVGRVEAQSVPAQPTQAISANPFGLLLELFNAEYERKVSESATAGFGGSHFANDDGDDYVNADIFYRYYPSGTPLDGWAFGVKVGMTNFANAGTHFGYGFDANRSWVLGKSHNFYVGLGFGLKKLVGTKDGDTQYIPTFRIVNIGFAF